jgi:hypothetical protein
VIVPAGRGSPRGVAALVRVVVPQRLGQRADAAGALPQAGQRVRRELADAAVEQRLTQGGDRGGGEVAELHQAAQHDLVGLLPQGGDQPRQRIDDRRRGEAEQLGVAHPRRPRVAALLQPVGEGQPRGLVARILPQRIQEAALPRPPRQHLRVWLFWSAAKHRRFH